MVALVEHDPGWAQAYDEEKQRIGHALAGLAVDIQHYGSTAVPGIRAKPILDIVVGIKRLAVGGECIQPLRMIGYDYLGDEFVPGGLFFARGVPRTHHLHVVDWCGTRWTDNMRFRDCLRAEPATARRYEATKIALADRYSADRASYTRSKAAFIASVLAAKTTPGR
jgi:GrpB-like predicted nucleotidyltransferase (UPF0157 family)